MWAQSPSRGALTKHTSRSEAFLAESVWVPGALGVIQSRMIGNTGLSLRMQVLEVPGIGPKSLNRPSAFCDFETQDGHGIYR